MVLLVPLLNAFLHTVLQNLNWLDFIIIGVFLSLTISSLLVQPTHKWLRFLKSNLASFLPAFALCFWRPSLMYAEENCARLILNWKTSTVIATEENKYSLQLITYPLLLSFSEN